MGCSVLFPGLPMNYAPNSRSLIILRAPYIQKTRPCALGASCGVLLETSYLLPGRAVQHFWQALIGEDAYGTHRQPHGE
jgi:hypothetical protein